MKSFSVTLTNQVLRWDHGSRSKVVFRGRDLSEDDEVSEMVRIDHLLCVKNEELSEVFAQFPQPFGLLEQSHGNAVIYG